MVTRVQQYVGLGLQKPKEKQEEYVPVSGSSDPLTKSEEKQKPLLDDWGKSDKH